MKNINELNTIIKFEEINKHFHNLRFYGQKLNQTIENIYSTYYVPTENIFYLYIGDIGNKMILNNFIMFKDKSISLSNTYLIVENPIINVYKNIKSDCIIEQDGFSGYKIKQKLKDLIFIFDNNFIFEKFNKNKINFLN